MDGNSQLKKVATQTCGHLFDYYAEFVLGGTYHRGAGTATVKFLTTPVPAALLAAGTVQANDEQVFIEATALASVTNPQPGDYLTETASGLRRDIVAAQLDLTRTMWTFIARRVFS